MADALLTVTNLETFYGPIMKCPRCQHENEAGAKFCEECATPLARVCAECGRPLSPMAKFCPECAHPVAAGAAEFRFAAPESYTDCYAVCR